MPKWAGVRNKMLNLRMSEIKESCIKYGAETVITSDLLCLALQPVSKEIIENFLSENTIVKIGAMDIPQIVNAGFTENQAIKINAIFEIARRWCAHSDEKKFRISGPRDVFNLMSPKLRGVMKEKFIVLILSTKNEVIREEVISIGSLNASIVHPREVFKPAIMCSAASVILVHNHPSGDPSPSREDIMITEKLVDGGKILGIDVLDHIIIGDPTYKSLNDEGFIR